MTIRECDRCHRPTPPSYEAWLLDCQTYCGSPLGWHGISDCTEARDLWQSAEIERLRPLADFGQQVLAMHRGYDADGNANPGDCPGDWLEEQAVECGLLVWRDDELFEVTR